MKRRQQLAGRARYRRATALFAALLSFLVAACDEGSQQGDSRSMQLGGDILSAAATLAISDSVAGDVIVAGGDVAFRGSAGGDILAAGETVVVGGSAGGSVRAAGGEVRVDAAVARNATLAGGDVELQPAAIVTGNLYAGGGTVRLAGTVHGGASIGAGEATIDGTIAGDVWVDAASMRVGPTARIGGTLRYRVPVDAVTIDPAAQIVGERIALAPRDDGPDLPWAALRVLWIAGMLVAGAAAVLLFPLTAQTGAVAIRQRGGFAALMGFVCFVATPIALAVAMVSIIGIPVALIGFFLYGVLVFLSGSITAVFAGRLILRQTGTTDRGRMLLAFLVGSVVIVLISLIPVLGVLAKIASLLLGLGALSLALRPGVPTPAATVVAAG
jgi:cytoskeletal protein CcmA (bactofilin family)